MSKRDAERGEPRLFDLPLAPRAEEAAAEEEAATPAPVAGEGELPLFPPEASPPEATAGRPRAAGTGRPAPPSPPPDRPAPALGVGGGRPGTRPTAAVPQPVRGPAPAPFGARLLAALADLGVHALVAVVGWAGVALAGARLGLADLPALGVFLLAFSFLYSVVSLAFWGRTPGMAAAGVVARGDGGQPLTFGQTGLRWLAGVLTALLAGLPVLLALTGRSFPDRLSGSRTFRLR